MLSTGLVLEGGGMRGVYSAGVLEYFLDQKLVFPYVVGVSAGACNAMSYISAQRGRNQKVTIGYVRHPRYLGVRNLFRERSLFGMSFIFEELPKLEPFDYDGFNASPQELVVGTTHCITGEPEYYRKSLTADMTRIVRASSSLPFFAPIIEIDGKPLLDGGVSDPIPVRQAIRDGFQRNVIVLTRNAGYRKSPFGWKRLAQRVYREYPGIVDAMVRRHQVYNDTLDYIDSLEAAGDAIVIRPSAPVSVSRMEKNPIKLQALFDLGYQDAQTASARIKEWGLPPVLQ